jgi:MoxR-like ATPase
MVLADEVNRAPTRTQSALLEVMQEHQVTVGGQTHFLPSPHLLIATQNTLESDGIWHLGEAQTDRFMMSIRQEYPDFTQERRMLALTTGSAAAATRQLADPATVLAMQRLARQVPVVPGVRDFALAIVRASRPGQREAAPQAEAALRLGASPRAAQALLLGAKVTALARGRTHVTRQDVIDVTAPAMAHRLLLDFRAEADGWSAEQVLAALVAHAQEKAMPKVSWWTRQLLRVRR